MLSKSTPSLGEFVSAFRDFMASHGVHTPDELIADSQPHYAHVEGHKPGTKKLAYKLYYTDNPGGYFKNFKNDNEPIRYNYFRDTFAKQKQNGGIPMNTTQTAVPKFLELYNTVAKPVPADYPYFKRKGLDVTKVNFETSIAFPNQDATRKVINHYEPRVLADGLMLIPFFKYNSVDGVYDFVGFETRKPDGQKGSVKGTQKFGACAFIGFPFKCHSETDPYYISESYTTGLAITISTGKNVLVVGGEKNLPTIFTPGRFFGSIFRLSNPVIAFDDDKYPTKTDEQNNAGRIAAYRACANTDRKILLVGPSFKPEDEQLALSEDRKLTDFCDVFSLYGPEETKRQLENTFIPRRDDLVKVLGRRPIKGELIPHDDKMYESNIWDRKVSKHDAAVQFLKETLVSQGFKFLSNQDDEYFVEYTDKKGHYNILPVSIAGKSLKSLKIKLFNIFCNMQLKTTTDKVVEDVIKQFVEECEKNKITTYKRVAFVRDTYYINRAVPGKKSAIVITKDGWHISDNPPVVFLSSPFMLPLITPEPNIPFKEVKEITEFLNINLDKDELEEILAFCIESWRPYTPYQLLNLIGEEGSGKTITHSILAELLDPFDPPLSKIDSNKIENTHVYATHRHLLCFENESFLSDEAQDTFCSVCTGHTGEPKRKKYTDKEMIFLRSHSPIILNSISQVITRPDLMSRTITLNLPMLANFNTSKYKTEKRIRSAWDAKKSRVFGAFLNLFVAVHQEMERMGELVPKSRQGDFEFVLQSVGNLFEKPNLVDKYLAKLKEQSLAEILEDPLTAKVVELYEERQKVGKAVIPNKEFYDKLRDTDPSYRYESQRLIAGLVRRSKKSLFQQGYLLTLGVPQYLPITGNRKIRARCVIIKNLNDLPVSDVTTIMNKSSQNTDLTNSYEFIDFTKDLPSEVQDLEQW